MLSINSCCWYMLDYDDSTQTISMKIQIENVKFWFDFCRIINNFILAHLKNIVIKFSTFSEKKVLTQSLVILFVKMYDFPLP